MQNGGEKEDVRNIEEMAHQTDKNQKSDDGIMIDGNAENERQEEKGKIDIDERNLEDQTSSNMELPPKEKIAGTHIKAKRQGISSPPS